MSDVAVLAAAAAVTIGATAYISYGWRLARATDRDKLATIERMHGRHVVVRIERGRLNLSYAGYLELAQEKGRVVLVGDDGSRQAVPLGQIRAIEDATAVQGEW